MGGGCSWRVVGLPGRATTPDEEEGEKKEQKKEEEVADLDRQDRFLSVPRQRDDDRSSSTQPTNA